EAENLDIDRLLVEIVGPEGDRAHRVLALLVAARDDDLGLRRALDDALERRQALARAVRVGRQAEIEHHHRRRVALHGRERRLPRSDDLRNVLGEGPFELALKARIVLDDEELRIFLRHASWTCREIAASAGAAGRRTMTCVPSPGALATSSLPPMPRMSSRAW